MPNFLRLLCLALLVFCVSNSATRSDEGKEQKAKQPDAAAIAKLVEKLGSADFKEREQATKALELIGFPALEALRKAAKSSDAEVAARAARLVKTIEEGFDQLLADYRAYDLPLPPKDAKLVRFESGGRGIVNGKLMPPTYFLGFLLVEATKDKPGTLLVGTQEIQLEPHTPVKVVEPKPELVKGIELRYQDGLVVALQCKARGWNALAQDLWTTSIKQDNVTNRTAVAQLAWDHSEGELVEPDSDRRNTAKRMKALLAAEPTLNTEKNRLLLKALEAALVPSTAKPGSVERMIDDLTEMCNTGRRHDEADPRYSRLAQKGFDAVPALIEHLHDERLTRSIRYGFNNFPTWNLRVNHVVSDLLQELAGDEIGKDWLERQKGWGVERRDAQAWWDKARKKGEEAYLLAHVLPSGKKAEWPNSLMLSIITEKYPKHLPKLYKTILDDRPKMQSWPVADAVAKSSLPKEKQTELFLHAAHHKNLEHRRFGLLKLQKLDQQQFMTILLETLEAFPKTPTDPYWKCPEAAFAHLVLATDDPKAWALLEKVAKRSDVGLRMEFMNPMNYSYVGEKQRQQRLKFLAAFLDDAEAPDMKANPKMFDGPHAGFTFRRLAVQDLASMKIASILEMPDEPDLEWTSEKWEELRKKVKESLKK